MWILYYYTNRKFTGGCIFTVFFFNWTQCSGRHGHCRTKPRGKEDELKQENTRGSCRLARYSVSKKTLPSSAYCCLGGLNSVYQYPPPPLSRLVHKSLTRNSTSCKHNQRLRQMVQSSLAGFSAWLQLCFRNVLQLAHKQPPTQSYVNINTCGLTVCTVFSL